MRVVCHRILGCVSFSALLCAACGSSNAPGSEGSGGRCKDAVGTGSPGLVDDLSTDDSLILNNDGRQGFWAGYSDGTGVMTPTPVPLNQCVPDYFFPTTNGKACISGSGFTKWGAGMNLALNATPYSCKGCNYDVTVYNGVRFTISGRVTGGYVWFSMSIADTVGVQWGGTCADETKCTDSYGSRIAVTDQPSVVELPWTSLRQAGWGTAAPLNLTEAHNLGWEVRMNSTASPLSFDNVCVDDISLY
jgi:hypothetical protein